MWKERTYGLHDGRTLGTACINYFINVENHDSIFSDSNQCVHDTEIYLHSVSFLRVSGVWRLCPSVMFDCLFGSIVVSVCVVRVVTLCPAPARRVTPGAGAAAAAASRPAPPVVSSSGPRPKSHRWGSSASKVPLRTKTHAPPHGPVIHLSVADATHWMWRHLRPDY